MLIAINNQVFNSSKDIISIRFDVPEIATLRKMVSSGHDMFECYPTDVDGGKKQVNRAALLKVLSESGVTKQAKPIAGNTPLRKVTLDSLRKLKT